MKILVSFPTDPSHPYIHKKIAMVQWKLSQDRRYQLEPMWPSHRPFENNLHLIIKDFIASDCAFWLSMDADNPPLKNPLDLISYNRDIIGLPTPVWHYIGEKNFNERPIYWNGYDYVPEKDAYKEHEPKKGLQKVDAIGTGCFLFSKRVFMNYEMQKGPFLRQYYPDGTVNKGNDFPFCEKAKAQGFEIYCHYGYPCDHFNELSLNEVIQAFKNLYGNNK